jgi:ubiquinone/menaquinone biosynthesis C-methylase UbiE
MSSERGDLALAQRWDRFAARFAKVYDIAVVVLPFWGGRLRKALPYLRGPKVLEVSFGTGYLMSRYAHKHEAWGLDQSEDMIKQANMRLTAKGMRATLVRGDAHAMPFPDDSFDCLLNTDAFSLYSDSQRAMNEFFRVLKPGGRLVLMEVNHPSEKTAGAALVLTLVRALKMPRVDCDTLLRNAGFTYEDVTIGGFGTQHIYVGEKPLAR